MRASRARAEAARSCPAWWEREPGFIFDLDGTVRRASPAALALVGRTRLALAGRRLWPLVAEADRAAFRAAVDALAETGFPQRVDAALERSGAARLCWTLAFEGRGRAARVVACASEPAPGAAAMRRELDLRNRIAQILLNESGVAMFDAALALVLEALESPLGLFGYVDLDETFVLPSVTREVLTGHRRSAGTMRIPRERWAGLWGTTLSERRPLLQNDGLTAPADHLPIQRALSVPILLDGALIGAFVVANRERDYTRDDLQLLERIAEATAPVLCARLQREWMEEERRTAEKALRDSELRFRTVFEGTNDPCYALDPTGRIREVNRAACASLGYTREELVQLRVADIDPDTTPELFQSQLAAIVVDGHAIFEVRHRRKDGSIFPAEIAARLIDFDGETAVLATARDLTARRRVEQALRESELRLRTLFATANDAIFIHEPMAPFSEVNAVACERLGYSREELLKLGPRDIDAPAYATDFPERMAEIEKTGRAIFEAAHRTKDGRIIPVEISLRMIDFEGRRVALSIARDISDRKQAERLLREANDSLERRVEERTAELRQTNAALKNEILQRTRAESTRERLQKLLQASAQEWHLTFDAVPEPVVVTDLEGHVIRLNTRAQQMVVSADWEGAHLAALGPGEPWRRGAELIAELHLGAERASAQVHDEATHFTWNLLANRFTSTGAAEDRVVLLARDMTELIDLQDALRRSEIVAAMGSLVSGVAHEVRNPLFGISATLDAFEARFAGQADFEVYLNVLRGEVGRLNKLMEDLLAYGRPTELDLKPTTIDRVFAEAARASAAVADTSRVRVRLQVEATPELLGDEPRLVQVFQNLIANAIQHSPAGGEVVARAVAREVHGRAWLDCSVEDGGPGIPPSDLKRIFRPFFTKRRSGTGLGLSIVQRIVEAHGGQVSASNRPEGGASLRVWLPVDGRAVAAAVA